MKSFNQLSFLETFLGSNFEFTFSNSSPFVYKILSYQSDFGSFSQQERNGLILAFFRDQFPTMSHIIDTIFQLFPEVLFHVGIDTLNKRGKLYISLYNTSFKESLRVISGLKKVLNISDPYRLEGNFLYFDCVGIDFSEMGAGLKIYEIVKDDSITQELPDFIHASNIKEVGYLKSHSMRKKKFFRLLQKQPIEEFSHIFDITCLNSFQEKIKDFYTLQKLVKYYCIEGEKKEIYFI